MSTGYGRSTQITAHDGRAFVDNSNEPNTYPPSKGGYPQINNEPNTMCIEFQEQDDNAIMEIEDEVEVGVALDSGCVVHTCGPSDIPTSVEVKHPPNERIRNLVNASGGDMENYGKAFVELIQENGQALGSSFIVTDVTRPLHSTSQVCDSESPACPDGHEVLYTKLGATVVPDGSLSRFLSKVRNVAKYPRREGLYVAKMKVRPPGARAPKKPNPKRPGGQGFGWQGARR